MADNTVLNLGAGGDVISADEVTTLNGNASSGVKVQRIKVGYGIDADYTDASLGNPLPVAAYGELIEAIEALRFAVGSLTKTIGYALPNALGQPIMEVRQATAANLQVTLGSIAGGQTIATVTTVGTLTNQTQIGGFAASDQIPALMHLQADNLRRNISVT